MIINTTNIIYLVSPHCVKSLKKQHYSRVVAITGPLENTMITITFVLNVIDDIHFECNQLRLHRKVIMVTIMNTMYIIQKHVYHTNMNIIIHQYLRCFITTRWTLWDVLQVKIYNRLMPLYDVDLF